MSVSIFGKLPLDVILYEILPYDPHFIIRKGELVSIIPKNDERYKILQKITIKKTGIYIIGDYNTRYEYSFHKNIYNHPVVLESTIEDDILESTIYFQENGDIQYDITISRLVPINKIQSLKNVHYIILSDITNYVWYYQHFSYIRK